MKPKIVCPECSAELQWGERFCAHCGKPIEWSHSMSQQPDNFPSAEVVAVPKVFECKQCGTQNPTDALVCKMCGADLQAGTQQPKQHEKQQESHSATTKKGSQVLKKSSDAAPTVSWKMVVGFAVFLVVGVFLLDTLTTRKPEVEVRNQEQSTQAPSANMRILPQIEELEKKVLANPNDTQSSLELANLLHDNRFYDKAIAYYQKYLEKNLKDPNARVDLGICYFDLGKLDEAEQQMKRALKDDPKHVLAHFNLGIVNLRAGKMKEANEWFKKTIALAPDGPVGQQAKQYLEQHSTL